MSWLKPEAWRINRLMISQEGFQVIIKRLIRVSEIYPIAWIFDELNPDLIPVLDQMHLYCALGIDQVLSDPHLLYGLKDLAANLSILSEEMPEVILFIQPYDGSY